ncbi:MAG TPA: hypothetical protein PK110_13135 [Niabella sp.]|jgi:hypothetical protein|nr:hypothetical protein [Chitinophagaceae bacterium]HRN47342.1 hypothetical protein [Niabella sp.]HRO85763.1 hypothetical protein [Niabella sp.]HUN01993.1 hypothetical protein [Niabella sp.]
MIRIRAFTAPEDPLACEHFIAGHRKILEIYYGIIKITSDSNEWVNDPHCIVIVAEDPETKTIYGGARLQVVSGKYLLPIESALSKYDPTIHDVVRHEFINGGTSEVCGLWNSKEIAGMGIGSHILSIIGVAVSFQIGIKSIFVLCAPSTVRMSRSMGTQVVTTLGNNGTFYYPKDNFIATVMRLDDVNDLQYADPKVAEKIHFLKDNNNCIVEERGPKGTFMVEYDIKIKNWIRPVAQ